MAFNKVARRNKIRTRIRARIQGTIERPRLSVFRSNSGIYCQLIDDLNGNTLLAISSKDKSLASAKITKIEMSKEVGKLLAQNAIAKGYSKIVFDRSGYLYHGRIKALADGAREGGLNF